MGKETEPYRRWCSWEIWMWTQAFSSCEPVCSWFTTLRAILPKPVRSKSLRWSTACEIQHVQSSLYFQRKGDPHVEETLALLHLFLHCFHSHEKKWSYGPTNNKGIEEIKYVQKIEYCLNIKESSILSSVATWVMPEDQEKADIAWLHSYTESVFTSSWVYPWVYYVFRASLEPSAS